MWLRMNIGVSAEQCNVRSLMKSQALSHALSCTSLGGGKRGEGDNIR